MNPTIRLHSTAVMAISLSTLLSSASAADNIQWERILVEPVFRSEGVAAADINHDGKIDVIHGEAWYECPPGRCIPFAS